MNVTSDLNIFSIILEAGIVVKLVLIFLLGVSVLSWAIILRKKKFINATKQNNRVFLDLYRSSSNLKDIFSKSEGLEFSTFHNLFNNGYLELEKITDSFSKVSSGKAIKSHFENFGLDSIERALKIGVNQSNIELEKKLGLLATIGSISPFVGLFGTVWGIINSFTGIASGGGTLDAVAPGIAEALVATAIGLLAAIPAVWFYNHYTTLNSELNTEMESFGQDFLNEVERSLVIT